MEAYNDPADDPRPLVTFALFSFNQEKYIREAIEGAFSQTYTPLEIILSDDCSSDATFAIMQQMAADYAGPHTVRLRRPEVNEGLVSGISTVSAMATGRLIVAAAGDDISLSDRTDKLVNAWRQNGYRDGLLYSHFCTIDDAGHQTPPPYIVPTWTVDLSHRDLSMLNNFAGLSGCTCAWTKSIFSVFGPIYEQIDREDLIIPIRSLFIGSITFLSDVLVLYRLTEGSISRKSYVDSSEKYKKMLLHWRLKKITIHHIITESENHNTKSLNFKDLNWIRSELDSYLLHCNKMIDLHERSGISRALTAIDPRSKLSLKERMKWLILGIYPRFYYTI